MLVYQDRSFPPTHPLAAVALPFSQNYFEIVNAGPYKKFTIFYLAHVSFPITVRFGYLAQITSEVLISGSTY